jgi:hypothetical protein
MTSYWLTPITRSEPVTLGAERVALSAAEGEALRSQWAKTHPWLLPSFKLALLCSDDEEDEACGISGGELSLHTEGDIALEGLNNLSHCGCAFIDRLLSPSQALTMTDGLPSSNTMEKVRNWWRAGFPVMLLKEEE